MNVELQEFYKTDPGFAQFAERHEAVTATPELRKAYRRWEYDRMLDALEDERKAAKQAASLAESEAKGRTQGEALGRIEGEALGRAQAETEIYLGIALKALKLNGCRKSQTLLDGELNAMGVPDKIIKEAHKIYDAEKTGLNLRAKNKSNSEPDL